MTRKIDSQKAGNGNAELAAQHDQPVGGAEVSGKPPARRGRAPWAMVSVMPSDASDSVSDMRSTTIARPEGGRS